MNIDQIHITNPLPEDIDIICGIAVAAWEGIHEGYRKYMQNDDLYSRISGNWKGNKSESIRGKAEKEPENVLIAKDFNGQIFGFATFSINKENGIGEIGNNAVLPEFQGMGIGKLLYKNILDVFRQKKLLYAVVSTGYEDEGHASARAAYEKAGFKKMKTSITYSLKL